MLSLTLIILSLLVIAVLLTALALELINEYNFDGFFVLIISLLKFGRD
jgi:hypothetical protein